MAPKKHTANWCEKWCKGSFGSFLKNSTHQNKNFHFLITGAVNWTGSKLMERVSDYLPFIVERKKSKNDKALDLALDNISNWFTTQQCENKSFEITLHNFIVQTPLSSLYLIWRNSLKLFPWLSKSSRLILINIFQQCLRKIFSKLDRSLKMFRYWC